MLLQKLADKKLISPPRWLGNNTVFLTLMGSHAYGTSLDSSDKDIWGIAIPPKDNLFPHLYGFIDGFGTQPQRFDEYEQHHIFDKEEDIEYDFKVMNIVKFFELARLGNPNVIDAIFVPNNCILHSTPVGVIIRENRHEFLSKLLFAKFKGYAYSSLKKMQNKEPVGKRKAIVDKYSYDTKYAFHLFRLLDEITQILSTHTVDLQQNREQHKAIRRGEWKEQDIYDYFNKKEIELETLYMRSTLRNKPDEAKLKNILLDCLEAHYGDLSKAVVRQDEAVVGLRTINEVIEGLKARKVF